MTARRAWDMQVDLSITIVTPEDAPLALFGTGVSHAVEELLEQHGILTITSAHAETPAAGEVSIRPGSRSLHVSRVIALPELVGPPAPGVPTSSPDGFIPVDAHGRVSGLERVFAAGDAVDFPVKFGGIAAQQADVAAEAIAALAGAPIEPSEFHPVITGILIGGPRPLYMRAHITGGHGASSEVSDEPIGGPATKIAAKYLSPYLEARDGAAVR
jgi:sulfide:quinone oxidoreductase